MTDLQTLNLSGNSDLRFTALRQFIIAQLKPEALKITMLAGDASFRRYFRVHLPDTTLVAMDAPPEKEDCIPFITIAKIFQNKGLLVPEIIRRDLEQGFLLLTDLGNDLYFRILQPSNADTLYKQAIDELVTIQSCQQNQGYVFPDFTPLIYEELTRFSEWYLQKHLQLSFTSQQETILADTYNALLASAISQPQVCVHRDYHSRNLLRLLLDGDAAENHQDHQAFRVGILDFQDAVWGPVTYDLVSLIRDCYIDWPQQQVHQWAYYYHQMAIEHKILNEKNFNLLMRWFDWMGIQRHLKAIYIFARKFHRDHNANYLNDIPRALRYIMDVTEQYSELKNFRKFLVSILNE